MTTPTASQYLDKHGNFAKSEADLHLVRVWYEDGSSRELTAQQYEALSGTEREAIRNAGVSVQVVDRRDGRY